jgi:hypothetical protein
MLQLQLQHCVEASLALAMPGVWVSTVWVCTVTCVSACTPELVVGMGAAERVCVSTVHCVCAADGATQRAQVEADATTG